MDGSNVSGQVTLVWEQSLAMRTRMLLSVDWIATGCHLFIVEREGCVIIKEI